MEIRAALCRAATKRHRTWRRERQPLVPARLRAKGWAISVYVDLSGSTHPSWEEAGAIARWLRKEYGARLNGFDVQVRPWDGVSGIKAGGGTMLGPIVSDLRPGETPVIITDGEFSDYDPQLVAGLGEPIWVLLPGSYAVLPGTIIRL